MVLRLLSAMACALSVSTAQQWVDNCTQFNNNKDVCKQDYTCGWNKDTLACFKKPRFMPTPSPTAEPSGAPTNAPTSEPTLPPTNAPTLDPTIAPTNSPTVEPTALPTSKAFSNLWFRLLTQDNKIKEYIESLPTAVRATVAVTPRPTTPEPTGSPTDSPTAATSIPTQANTLLVTGVANFSPAPTWTTTARPTAAQTAKPTAAQTNKPSTQTPQTPHPTNAVTSQHSSTPHPSSANVITLTHKPTPIGHANTHTADTKHGDAHGDAHGKNDTHANDHKKDEHATDEHEADASTVALIVGVGCLSLIGLIIFAGGYLWYYHGDSHHHKKSKAIDDALSGSDTDVAIPAAVGMATVEVNNGSGEIAGHVDQSNNVQKATAERVF